MDPAAAVTILAAVLIIVALVVYLVAVILELRKITSGLDVVIGAVGEIVSKSAPVNDVVKAINSDLEAGSDLLEGLLEKKAGEDAAGLVESVFPGGGVALLARRGRRGDVKNIDEVYTRGAVQLARLGRESPLGAGGESGAALRDATSSSAAALSLYSKHAGLEAAPGDPGDPAGGLAIPRSPTIGTGAPTVYRPGEEDDAHPEPAESADLEVSRDAGDEADAVVSPPSEAKPGEKDEPDMKDMAVGPRPIDDQSAQ